MIGDGWRSLSWIAWLFEATAADASGATVRALKGAFAAVATLTPSASDASPNATATANELEAQGFRVLAVAIGPPAALKLAGIIALSGPPRPDSAALITELRTLGVRAVMVTGDAPATVSITVSDSAGNLIGTSSVSLGAQSKTEAVLRSLPGLGGMVGNLGSAAFTVASGNVAVLGISIHGPVMDDRP